MAASCAVAFCLLASACGSDQEQFQGTLADPADYRVESPDMCFELDVFNISETDQTFIVQLLIGSEYSEAHRTTIPAGRSDHLHLFPEAWTGEAGFARVLALSETFCQTLVFVDE